MASLRDLCSVYGTEDCYDLLEVANVDAHNRAVRRRWEEEQK